MFVLVRHAHAGNKRSWSAPDRDRPLSPEGENQAADLVPLLSAVAPRALVSSPYLRCRQTLAPLAALLDLPLAADDLLAPDSEPAALDRLLADPGADHTIYCTHGETLSALFERWERTGVLAGPGPASTPKGAAWLVAGPPDARLLSRLPLGPPAD